MLVPAGWGVLYPDRRGASTAGPAPTIVGRAMWEVRRGAWGVGHEKSGLWWRKRLGKGQSQGAKSVKPPPPWNSLLWDDANENDPSHGSIHLLEQLTMGPAVVDIPIDFLPPIVRIGALTHRYCYRE